jgi:hypothetical protein
MFASGANHMQTVGLAEIHCFQTGWQVVFHGVPHMPERVAIPLPLTATATEQQARAWLRARWPAIAIELQHAK